jgi:hypothetical protein
MNPNPETPEVNTEVNMKERLRKSLAVDQDTFDLLEAICFSERRSKIDQLKILIEREHKEIFGDAP